MKYVKPWCLFHDLLKTNAPKRGRFLGLDVGDKYVGLAVSDPRNTVASPLSVLLRKKTNIGLMAEDFETLISELSLVGFVVGYPFQRPESPGEFSSMQVNHFINELSGTGKLGDVKYTYWDESFTSKIGESFLKPWSQLHPVHSKTAFDKFAAVGILQGYLDYVNRKMKLEKAEQDDP